MTNIMNLQSLGYKIEADESGVIAIRGFGIAMTMPVDESEDILRSVLASHLQRVFPPLNITVT